MIPSQEWQHRSLLSPGGAATDAGLSLPFPLLARQRVWKSNQKKVKV